MISLNNELSLIMCDSTIFCLTYLENLCEQKQHLDIISNKDKKTVYLD